jgi:glycine/D-amino acid oxidase-like deaminating enzyme
MIGAGIVGCACALECIRAGLKVAVVEQGIPGAGATAAGMGHVVVMDDSTAQLALTGYSRRLWADLAAELPSAVEYEPRGTVWVAADDAEMEVVHVKQKTYASAQVESEVLDARSLAKLEPNLRPGLAGGLLVPGDAVIYPPTAAAYFLERAVDEGAMLLRGRSVTSIGRGTVKLADGSAYASERIVVATGSDTRLLPWLPIQKRKGHLLISDRYPGFVHHQLVELGYLKSAHAIKSDSVAFNVQPRSTGQLLIGSSRQYGAEEPEIDPVILRRMLTRAASYLPSLTGVSVIRAWTGFRAATPDNLPLIGPTADPSIFVAMGFEGLGITNSPGAARLLVDGVLGRASEIDRTPYLPSRVSSLEACYA